MNFGLGVICWVCTRDTVLRLRVISCGLGSYLRLVFCLVFGVAVTWLVPVWVGTTVWVGVWYGVCACLVWGFLVVGLAVAAGFLWGWYNTPF